MLTFPSTMTFVIIADIVSLQDRGKYQGIIEAVSAITNGLGPLLGATTPLAAIYLP
jgi:hypothetical protein